MANQVVAQQSGMPQANDYARDLGQARAVAMIAELQGTTAADPHGWGYILVQSGLRPDGYAHTKRWSNAQLASRAAGQVLSRNTGQNFLWHRVAFLAQHGRDVRGVCSHQCPNKNCIAHSLDETQAVNLSRRTCMGRIVCPRHGTVLYDFCQHNPQCIKLPVYGNCCGNEGPASVGGSEHESDVESRVIPDSQLSAETLSDILSRLGEPEDLPGSDFLALDGSQEPLELDFEENGSDLGESAEHASSDHAGSQMDTSMASVNLNADDEEEDPESSPIRGPGRRRATVVPVQLSSSSPRPPSSPINSQSDSFIVDDDVVIYDSSAGAASDTDD